MNNRKVTIFGKEFIIQDKELKNPKLFEIKGLVKKPFCTAKRKLILGIALLCLISTIIILSLIPVFIANRVCLNNKCENNSTCTIIEGKSYTCKCLNGFYGSYCENYDACWNDPCEGCQATGPNEHTFVCLCGIKYNDSSCITNKSSQARLVSELNNGSIAIVYEDNTIRVWKNSLFRSFSTIRAHNNSIKSMTILENGNIVSGSCDESIKIWHKESFELIQTIHNHSGCVNALKAIFIQNKQFLASGGEDKYLKIWQLSSDSSKSENVFTFSSHLEPILTLDYNSEYQYIASGSDDKLIILWKFDQYKIIKEWSLNNQIDPLQETSIPLTIPLIALNDDRIISGDPKGYINIYTDDGQTNYQTHSGPITSLIQLDEPYLASASFDQTIKIRKLTKTGLDEVKTLNGHTGSVTSLLKLNTNYFISGSSDYTIKIWNSKTFELNSTILDHSSTIVGLATNEYVDFWISGSYDYSIKIWNQSTFNIIYSINNIKSLISSLVVLNNGKILSAHFDGIIKVWNKNTFDLFIEIQAHQMQSYQIINLITLSNNLFVSSSNFDNTIKIWNQTDLKLITTLLNHDTDDAISLGNGKNGRLITATSNVKLWNEIPLNITYENVNSELSQSKTEIVSSHDDSVTVVKFYKNFLLSGSKDTNIKLWSINPPILLKNLNDHSNEISSLAICEQKNCNFLLASSSIDGIVNFWDEILNKINSTQNSGRVNSMSFLNNNNLLSIAISDGSLKLLDLNIKLSAKYVLNKHTKSVQDIISLDNGNLISCSGDKSILIWNKEQNVIANLTDHTDYVYALAIISNNMLASGSKDKSIKIWNLSSNTLVKSIYAHENSVISLTSLPNNMFASGSCDNTIKILNSSNYLTIYTLKRHSNCINALDVFKNLFLLSASSDKTILVWDLNKKFNLAYTLRGHQDSVNALAVTLDGSIASGSSDKSIKIWPLYTTKTSIQINDAVFKIIKLKNGKIAIATGNGHIIISKNDTFQRIERFVAHNNSINDLIELPDGNLISCSERIKVWYKNNNNSYSLFKTLEIPAKKLTFDLEHGLFISASKEILIWNYTTYNIIANLSDFNTEIGALKIFQVDNTTRLYAGSNDGTIRIWIYNSEKNIYEFYENWLAHNKMVYSLVMQSNGNFATASGESVIKIWNKNYVLIKTLESHFNDIYSLAVLSNDDLVSVSLDTTIIVWEGKSYDRLCVLFNKEPIYDVIPISEDSFLSGGFDQKITKWEKSFNCSKTLQEHKDSVFDLGVISNGLLVSASQDKTIKIWDNSYNILASEQSHSKAVLSLNTLEDTIISASEDKTIKEWNLNLYNLNKTVYLNDLK